MIPLSSDAHSTEIVADTKSPVVINMPEISTTQLGGTMRLGDRVTIFQPNTEKTKIRKLYGGVEKVHERHRHRYEVNPKYVSKLEEGGLKFIGRDEKGERMIIFELEGEFWFLLRSSILCCSAISPRIQDSTTQTIAPIPWLHLGCQWWVKDIPCDA